MKNIVIFASGRGSNAEKIINHFRNHNQVKISAIVSNKVDAGVLDLALRNGIPTRVLSKKVFFKSTDILNYLKEKNTDLIILAGFLWLIPSYLVEVYPDRIINIHPALLPKYGGKGMYGHHVHQAVKAAKETESGITIHYVNEHFDEGQHIAQFRTPIDAQMTADDIATAVLKLEHQHFAATIEKVLLTF